MTPKRAEEIRQEIINSGGWASRSATKEEVEEIMDFWKTLDDASCFFEAVSRMAKDATPTIK